MGSLSNVDIFEKGTGGFLNKSARANREDFFVTARCDFAGILSVFQEIATKRKRPRDAEDAFVQRFLKQSKKGELYYVSR